MSADDKSDSPPKEKEEPKTKPEKKKKKSKRTLIKVGHTTLDAKCCVIKDFDDMQEARQHLGPLQIAFPQFSLPFMYDDDLPNWPVRVEHPCWQCDSTHARTWSFMHDEDNLHTVYICESCRTMSEILIVAYPRGKRQFKFVSAEEHWYDLLEFGNDWKTIIRRAKAEGSSTGRLFARISHMVAGPAESPEEKAEREKSKKNEADQQKAEKERTKKEKKEIAKLEKEKAKLEKEKAKLEKEKAKKKKDKKENDKPKEDDRTDKTTSDTEEEISEEKAETAKEKKPERELSKWEKPMFQDKQKPEEEEIPPWEQPAPSKDKEEEDISIDVVFDD